MKHSIDIDKLDVIYDSGNIIVYSGYVLSIKMIIVKSKLIVGYIGKEEWQKYSHLLQGKKINKVEEGYYIYFREENNRLYLL